MKKILSILSMAFFALAICAQEKDVTTFLGIPVDGSKSKMKKKLISKGFASQRVGGIEFFEGEFNGVDVDINIVTNNNKVFRLVLHDRIHQDEASIKVRFNNLVSQFENNKRYYTPEDFTIPEDEDISHEMIFNNKLYSASYFQIPNTESMDALQNQVMQVMLSKYTEEQLKTPTKEIEEEQDRIVEQLGIELFSKKPVWFCIHEFEGKYYITMYYDNEYNHANGEDL
jgi:hypothetical protein